MDLCSFGLENGFVEAKIWGYRSTFLKTDHYS